jgi:hypothetical protein
VLLAVGLSLGLVRAWWEFAMIENGLERVFVVDMTFELLLGRPAKLVILATWLVAFKGAAVRLLVLRQIARSLELLVAARFAATLGCQLCGRSRTLATCHGSKDGLVILGVFEFRDLSAAVLVFLDTFHLDGLTSCDGKCLSVLYVYKFCRTTIAGDPAIKFHLVSPA